MRHRIIEILQLALFFLLAVFPLLYVSVCQVDGGFENVVFAIFNLAAWSLLSFFLIRRKIVREKVYQIADEIDLNLRRKSLETITLEVIDNIQRKYTAISINLIEKQIRSKEELSKILERIVALAYHLLNAESAELALFDTESNMYHSSFVIGKPFGTSSQAMLAGAADGEEEEKEANILVQRITFAGSILGTIRIALKKEAQPNSTDQEILRIIALQSGLAILNASYTDELKRMKRVSDESVKVKTGFLANLSHEIRGPLGIILNAVELIMDGLCGTVTDDQRETLSMIKFNGDHLLDLINDVLDYAKIESGKIVPQQINIVVDDLLKDIVSVMKKQAEKKSHTLIFKDSPEDLNINIDKRHSRQIMINLLTNAIKYTPEGGKIEVWAERSPHNRVKINVRDNGIGIEESARDKVFSAFERIENAYSIKQVGAGLGMAVTKKLVEVNGGQIDFKSVPNQGTHFWVSFPAEQLDSTENEDDKDNEDNSVNGNGDLILLVDPSEQERGMTSQYLEHVGFNVISVGSKAEALDALTANDVKLIMLDNSVIDKRHEDLVQDIRSTAHSNLLPIILVSSKAFTFDIEKYLKEGIDLCLTKPISLTKIAYSCRKTIDGKN